MLDAFVILLPFKSISFEVGLSLYAFQIPIALLLLKNIVKARNVNFYIDWKITFFLFYVFISTILISNIYIDYFVKNNYFDSYFRGEGRYISTLIKFIFLDFGIIYLFHNIIKDKEKIYELIKKYTSSVIILCILGIVQVVVSIFSGIDIFPNNVNADGSVRSGLIDFIDSLVPFVRLTSIGGEPKNIAATLSVGIMFLAFFNRQNILIYKHQRLAILFFIVCMIFTLSTSGFGLLVLLLGVLLLSGVTRKSFWVIKYSYLYIIPIISILIYFSWDVIYDVVDARIVKRANE